MANIIRSPIWLNPRIKPPFGAVEVDWGHPLSAGLRILIPFNEGGGEVSTLFSGIKLAEIGTSYNGFTTNGSGIARNYSSLNDRSKIGTQDGLNLPTARC